ncbi:hypothetical protein Pelo_15315 [Pelomyxa schiedti]|nr:hypothetical protein Pelo_15315 [Pelomyxa schiedti]
MCSVVTPPPAPPPNGAWVIRCEPNDRTGRAQSQPALSPIKMSTGSIFAWDDDRREARIFALAQPAPGDSDQRLRFMYQAGCRKVVCLGDKMIDQIRPYFSPQLAAMLSTLAPSWCVKEGKIKHVASSTGDNQSVEKSADTLVWFLPLCEETCNPPSYSWFLACSATSRFCQYHSNRLLESSATTTRTANLALHKEVSNIHNEVQQLRGEMREMKELMQTIQQQCAWQHGQVLCALNLIYSTMPPKTAQQPQAPLLNLVPIDWGEKTLGGADRVREDQPSSTPQLGGNQS